MIETWPKLEGHTTSCCPHCGGTGERVVYNQQIVAGQLRLLRDAKGLRQRAVAKLMGVSQAYVCDLEHGRRDWSERLVHAYCAALDGNASNLGGVEVAELSSCVGLKWWRVVDLTANPLNPRGQFSDDSLSGLIESIQALGILTPLSVTTDGAVTAGHRRLRAATLAGLERVPALTTDASQSDAERLAMALAENMQREDLSPMQEARAYRALSDMGMSTREIGRRVGVAPSTIKRRIQLLELPEEVQGLVAGGQVSIELARAIHKGDPETQIAIARRAVAEPTTANVGGRPRRVEATVVSAQALAADIRRGPPLLLQSGHVADAFSATCVECRGDASADNSLICGACPMLGFARRVRKLCDDASAHLPGRRRGA